MKKLLKFLERPDVADSWPMIAMRIYVNLLLAPTVVLLLWGIYQLPSVIFNFFAQK